MTVTAKGVDYAFQHPTVQSLVDGGYTFAVRYLYPYSQNPGTKNLTLAEANNLNAALLHGVVSNYEGIGGEPLKGFAQGVADAHDAQAQHVACGGPPDRPIYFSVDFNTDPSQYTTIGGYFKGVASVIGLAQTGAYGEYEIIKYLFDQGLITWGWQTYAWSAGAFDERCQLAQDLNGQSLGGGNVDFDSAHAEDFGQWNYKGGDMVQLTQEEHDAIINTWNRISTVILDEKHTYSLQGIKGSVDTVEPSLAALKVQLQTLIDTAAALPSDANVAALTKGVEALTAAIAALPPSVVPPVYEGLVSLAPKPATPTP